MSEAPVAPQPGAAPQNAAPIAPSPSTHEVPINENPVPAPKPVGDQAPEKPADTRHPSRRESIRAAFERAQNPQKAKAEAKPAPKPAEAKKGHNNPPEEMADEDKLDLKKRPSEQPRGERGQFAPRQQEAVKDEQRPELVNAGQPDQRGQPARKELPPEAPYRDPLPRMSEHAKAEWATAPESVRGEVHRMAKEYQGAYEQYRGDHEAMQPIRHFHEMAKSHGTTLDKALTNYVSMEQKLRQDVVGGLDIIVNNLGLKTPDGQRLGLRDIAYHILNQSPEQAKLVQQQNATQAASHQIGALHQEVSGLKDALMQMHNAQRYSYTRSAVDQFADSHPRFDEVADLIEAELDNGFDLEAAYKRACLLRPATHAAQTRNPSAQTRQVDRSISGYPAASTPSNGAARKNGKAVGRREAIKNAISSVNGSL
jgi:hypothetical protein